MMIIKTIFYTHYNGVCDLIFDTPAYEPMSALKAKPGESCNYLGLKTLPYMAQIILLTESNDAK